MSTKWVSILALTVMLSACGAPKELSQEEKIAEVKAKLLDKIWEGKTLKHPETGQRIESTLVFFEDGRCIFTYDGVDGNCDWTPIHDHSINLNVEVPGFKQTTGAYVGDNNTMDVRFEGQEMSLYAPR